MANVKRTHKAFRSIKASRVPGDDLRRAVSPIYCADGTVLPVGTLYRPLCSGEDWAAGRRYSDITVTSEVR